MSSAKTVDVEIELDAATLDFFKAKWPDDYADRMTAVLRAYVRAQTTKTIPVDRIFAEWHKDPDYRREYEALRGEFTRADQPIKAQAAK